MLKKRIITAIILIPLAVMSVFYLSPASFCLLTAAITLAAAWEWANLMELKKKLSKILYLLVMSMVFFVTLFIPMSAITMVLLLGGLWWLFALILVILYPRGSSWWGSGFFWRGLMGIFVLVPCWVALNFIRNVKDGPYILMFLFILIWGADTAAYFCGKKWGKTKLLSEVSPGKTVEGMVGALIYTVLIALVALWVCQNPYQMWPWAVGFSIITILFSILGDLLESMLKRKAGLKDSGRLLPGHGGLLDRIDSLTAAAPIYTLCALLLGRFIGS